MSPHCWEGEGLESCEDSAVDWQDLCRRGTDAGAVDGDAASSDGAAVAGDSVA